MESPRQFAVAPLVVVTVHFGPLKAPVPEEHSLFKVATRLLQTAAPQLELVAEVVSSTIKEFKDGSSKSPDGRASSPDHSLDDSHERGGGRTAMPTVRLPVKPIDEDESDAETKQGQKDQHERQREEPLTSLCRTALEVRSYTHGTLCVSTWAQWEAARDMVVEEMTGATVVSASVKDASSLSDSSGDGGGSKNARVDMQVEIVVLWYDVDAMVALRYDNLFTEVDVEEEAETKHVMSRTDQEPPLWPPLPAVPVMAATAPVQPLTPKRITDTSTTTAATETASAAATPLIAFLALYDTDGAYRGKIPMHVREPIMSLAELTQLVKLVMCVRRQRGLRIAYHVLSPLELVPAYIEADHQDMEREDRDDHDSDPTSVRGMEGRAVVLTFPEADSNGGEEGLLRMINHSCSTGAGHGSGVVGGSPPLAVGAGAAAVKARVVAAAMHSPPPGLIPLATQRDVEALVHGILLYGSRAVRLVAVETEATAVPAPTHGVTSDHVEGKREADPLEVRERPKQGLATPLVTRKDSPIPAPVLHATLSPERVAATAAASSPGYGHGETDNAENEERAGSAYIQLIQASLDSLHSSRRLLQMEQEHQPVSSHPTLTASPISDATSRTGSALTYPIRASMPPQPAQQPQQPSPKRMIAAVAPASLDSPAKREEPAASPPPQPSSRPRSSSVTISRRPSVVSAEPVEAAHPGGPGGTAAAATTNVAAAVSTNARITHTARPSRAMRDILATMASTSREQLDAPEVVGQASRNSDNRSRHTSHVPATTTMKTTSMTIVGTHTQSRDVVGGVSASLPLKSTVTSQDVPFQMQSHNAIEGNISNNSGTGNTNHISPQHTVKRAVVVVRYEVDPTEVYVTGPVNPRLLEHLANAIYERCCRSHDAFAMDGSHNHHRSSRRGMTGAAARPKFEPIAADSGGSPGHDGGECTAGGYDGRSSGDAATGGAASAATAITTSINGVASQGEGYVLKLHTYNFSEEEEDELGRCVADTMQALDGFLPMALDD